MKPQRTSASKPGLELQILSPCLLGNSAVFKILIKALFKLRRLWKYIRQSLFTFIFIQLLFTEQQSVFPRLLKTCISILPICTRCIPVTPSQLFILVHKYKNNLLQIQSKCINSLLFLYHLGTPTQKLSEICGFTEERGSEEGLKRMLPFQSRVCCSNLWRD